MNHGVRYFGCSRAKSSGSWRCSASDHDSRLMPISPALVAMRRIVAASTPTYARTTCSRPPESPNAETTPSTGSLAYFVPSAVAPCTTGSADSATTDMPA